MVGIRIEELIVEQISILQKEVAMRQARLVPGKHGTSYLMLSLK